MAINKDLDSVKADVNSLETRLGVLEDQKLEGQLERLQEKHDKLAEKLSEMTGSAKVIGVAFTVVAIVFAVLSALTGLNMYRYHKFEVVRDNAYEVLVDSFENKIADTVDRISFIDPSNEQIYKIKEMTDMRDLLKQMEFSSKKFELRSQLADAIKLVLDRQQEDQANRRLSEIEIAAAPDDNFVRARVLTLEAMLLVRQDRTCKDPNVEPKVREALRKDSGVAAAYNILGVCLTDAATKQVTLTGAQGEKSVKTLLDGISYYELAFTLKPTDWTRARNLNNEVSAKLSFLEATLREEKMDEALASLGYAKLDSFVFETRRQVSLTQQLASNQSAYWETEAELDGLRYLYYQQKKMFDDAGNASIKEKSEFHDAISRGLFKKFSKYADAYKYLCDNTEGDPLLKNLCSDQEILDRIKTETSH